MVLPVEAIIQIDHLIHDTLVQRNGIDDQRWKFQRSLLRGSEGSDLRRRFIHVLQLTDQVRHINDHVLCMLNGFEQLETP